MIYSVDKKISLDTYKRDEKNAGKILLIRTGDCVLLKEGTEDNDWLPLQLEYEELNKKGGYLLSIVPKTYNTINSFIN